LFIIVVVILSKYFLIFFIRLINYYIFVPSKGWEPCINLWLRALI